MIPSKPKEDSLPSQDIVDSRKPRRGRFDRVFRGQKYMRPPKRKHPKETETETESKPSLTPVDTFFTLEYLPTQTVHRAILITMYFDEALRDLYVESIKNRNSSIITVIDEGDAEKLMSGSFGLVPDVFVVPADLTIDGETVYLEDVSKDVIPQWAQTSLRRFYEPFNEKDQSELFYYFTRK